MPRPRPLAQAKRASALLLTALLLAAHLCEGHARAVDPGWWDVPGAQRRSVGVTAAGGGHAQRQASAGPDAGQTTGRQLAQADSSSGWPCVKNSNNLGPIGCYAIGGVVILGIFANMKYTQFLRNPTKKPASNKYYATRQLEATNVQLGKAITQLKAASEDSIEKSYKLQNADTKNTAAYVKAQKASKAADIMALEMSAKVAKWEGEVKAALKNPVIDSISMTDPDGARKVQAKTAAQALIASAATTQNIASDPYGLLELRTTTKASLDMLTYQQEERVNNIVANVYPRGVKYDPQLIQLEARIKESLPVVKLTNSEAPLISADYVDSKKSDKNKFVSKLSFQQQDRQFSDNAASTIPNRATTGEVYARDEASTKKQAQINQAKLATLEKEMKLLSASGTTDAAAKKSMEAKIADANKSKDALARKVTDASKKTVEYKKIQTNTNSKKPAKPGKG